MKQVKREDCTALVLGHKGGQDIITQLLPEWFRLSSRVIIYLPENHEIEAHGCEIVQLGESAHHGNPGCNIRTAAAFRRVFDDVKTRYVMHYEYDSWVFGDIRPDEIPAEGGMSAWSRRNKKPEKWLSERFCWYPQLYTNSGMQRVSRALDALKPDAEDGMIDRFLGCAITLAGIPVNNIHSLGRCYSQETIKEEHVAQATDAIKDRAHWIHGVKNPDIFKTLRDAYKTNNPHA